MRRLIVTENITVDGVISPIGAWFDPMVPDDELAAVNQQHSADADGLLLGRVTYEEFAGFWPQQQGAVSAYLDRVDKYVVSTSLDKAEWQNTTVLSGPLADEVTALKQRDGKDITVTGSATLVRSLIPTGLIDVYRLFIYPVVQGSGARLFDGVTLPLSPTRTKAFVSGVVLLEYTVR